MNETVYTHRGDFKVYHDPADEEEDVLFFPVGMPGWDGPGDDLPVISGFGVICITDGDSKLEDTSHWSVFDTETEALEQVAVYKQDGTAKGPFPYRAELYRG